MVLELRQQLKMTQQLVMTPQLQQAIKLLQLNHLELAELVGQEIVENPVLEELHEERADPLAEQAKVETPAAEDPNAEGRSEQTELDWERYLDSYRSGPRTGSEVRRNYDDLPTYDQTLTRKTSLADHLVWQLHMNDASGLVRAAAVEIIGNLEGSGYLRTTLEDLTGAGRSSLPSLRAALELVQGFDPLGVGARDLRECLLIQARVLHPDNRVLLSLLDKHMQALERRDYKSIARGLGVSLPRVVEAVRTLSSLEPRPGRSFVDEEPRYITPDVHIIKTNSGYAIQLNEEGVPRLRVSEYYRKVLMGAAKGDKEYIQEKLRSAQWLIRSIYQRQRTIYKVTESIVKQQRSFFDDGIAMLKPMILRDVADDIGMHESTVSRATTNKYAHTPHGIFSLKFFFNSAIKRNQGEDVASEMVKQQIKAIVGEENPRKPLSDQKLVELLAANNIKIARRTVAKYREMMGIPSSSRRKRLF